ncbi:MAG: hypothetical protein IT307_12485 [Chloroflexi bacterium]|nr:hypothetical protein [Chloroflexota bacterium]
MPTPTVDLTAYQSATIFDPAEFGRRVVEHLPELESRTARAVAYVVLGRVHRLHGAIYHVDGSEGQTYRVDFQAGTCECADYQHGRAPRWNDVPTCKHLIVIMGHRVLEVAVRNNQQPAGQACPERL